MVRVFAGWLQGFDARTEVPPRALTTSRPRRTRPYIYKDDQLAAIVVEAARLRSSYGLREWTCSTLFGLIAVTGLRVNEAHALDEEDADLKQGVLTVRGAKNRKSRFVPISPCATERLKAYRSERNRILGAGRPHSSCSRMASVRLTAAPAITSRWSVNESAFASRSPSINMAVVRASMIPATPSQCARCWTGIVVRVAAHYRRSAKPPTIAFASPLRHRFEKLAEVRPRPFDLLAIDEACYAAWLPRPETSVFVTLFKSAQPRYDGYSIFSQPWKRPARIDFPYSSQP